jgi:hypothetical protein
MKLPITFSSLILFASLAWASAVWANNNNFLPGDAFFPTILVKADVEALQKTKTGERRFVYSSMGGYDGAFCGYAGYLNATIPAVDDRFARNLKRVYTKIRKIEGRKLWERTIDGKISVIETNGIRVLFYPLEFDFQKYTLGLRYNEDWVAETIKFGHKKEHIRLCCLISNPDAVEESWRDAEDVPPLSAKTPKVKLLPVPETTAPVLVEWPVQAIVIGSQSLKDIFEAKNEGYYSLYIVRSDGIQSMEYQSGEWKSYEFKE